MTSARGLGLVEVLAGAVPLHDGHHFCCQSNIPSPIASCCRSDAVEAEHYFVKRYLEALAPAVERIVAERVAAYVEAVGRVEAALRDGPDTWEGYDSRDTGHVFVADLVLDFTAEVRAALLGVTEAREGAQAGSEGVRSADGHLPRVPGPDEASEGAREAGL